MLCGEYLRFAVHPSRPARCLVGEEDTMTETTPSLYRRLGGYDVIAAIIDDMFALFRKS